MNVHDLLSELSRRDIRIGVDNGQLLIRAPRGALSEPLSAALREHKAHILDLLTSRSEAPAELDPAEDETPHWSQQSFEQFMFSDSPQLVEVNGLAQWRQAVKDEGLLPMFEVPHLSGPRTVVQVEQAPHESTDMLNFASYNYMGYATHPEVIAAAKASLDTYGLGAASSPVLSGTLGVHRDLEQAIVDLLGQPDHGVSLFSSGYGTNLGAISAFLNPGQVLVCDRKAHMSILEGGKLAGARMCYFEHNDPDDLDRVLGSLAPDKNRVLVAVEGLYSVDGDFGRIAEIAAVCQSRGAYLLVDEAHSMLLTGPGGRGVAAAQGVLDKVDLLIMTFSKSFGGVGGGLYARKEIVQYVNWYARCRMFSAALDPAVTGGLVRSAQLAMGPDGARRRARLHRNAEALRARLQGRFDLGGSASWIVSVRCGAHDKTPYLADWLRREGQLDVGIVAFPAVPRDASRLRLFVTSEHTEAQLDRAAEVLLQAGEQFGFLLDHPMPMPSNPRDVDTVATSVMAP